MAKNISSKFGVAEGFDFSEEPSVTSVAIDKLVPFKDHCFKLYEGERLDDMIQSVKKNGIINPILVRSAEGGKYEILSGHNRVYAAGQAGLAKVPAYIKYNLSDEEALLIVVETNLMQRGFSDLRISEQAYAVAVRYEKLFDERKLKSITDELYFLENGKQREAGDPVDHRRSRVIIGEEYGVSQATVARLVRINTLIDEIKKLVDMKNICIRAAVEISYLTEEQQKMLYGVMTELEVTVIDMKMSKEIRSVVTQCAKVTREHFVDVLTGTGSEDKPKEEKAEKIMLPKATYNRYLASYSKKAANEIIEKALALYFEKNETED